MYIHLQTLINHHNSIQILEQKVASNLSQAIGGLLLMEKTTSPFAYLLASLALLVSGVSGRSGLVPRKGQRKKVCEVENHHV